MNEIWNCLPRPPSRGKAPLSVFLKDTTEWREWVLNRDHVGDEHGALTTRPRCRQVNLMKSVNFMKERYRTCSKTNENLFISLFQRARYEGKLFSKSSQECQ